ncbi:unnamed protein product [Sphenostylis stenocarpa]|uniref:Uncharacterized protein n=1 Tax=Sphenostylis stenocarpa TaxID=92480 RepID=A0AA87B8A4_9FABA|nr:unnamed protein product [Sphenostylis stenocarpa]
MASQPFPLNYWPHQWKMKGTPTLTWLIPHTGPNAIKPLSHGPITLLNHQRSERCDWSEKETCFQMEPNVRRMKGNVLGDVKECNSFEKVSTVEIV